MLYCGWLNRTPYFVLGVCRFKDLCGLWRTYQKRLIVEVFLVFGVVFVATLNLNLKLHTRGVSCMLLYMKTRILEILAKLLTCVTEE